MVQGVGIDMNLKQQTIDTYNASADAIADKLNKSGARVEDVARLFGYVDVENPRVLEIGCAQGRDVSEILKFTDRYVGTDVSEKLLSIARRSFPDVEFEEADVEVYDFPDGLDVVIAFASLIHTSKNALEVVLGRIHDSLHRGGILYASMKRSETYEEYVREEAYRVRTYYLYNRELFAKLAGEGWEVIFERDYDWRGIDWFDIVLKKL